MQYLILLSALMSLATVVMAQDVDTVFDDSGEAAPVEGVTCAEPVSATALAVDELEEAY